MAKKMLWKDLTKKEKSHLRDMGIRTLRDFKYNAAMQAEMRRKFPEASEPCWDCRMLAKKFELPI
jgi:hypothetical protein